MRLLGSATSFAHAPSVCLFCPDVGGEDQAFKQGRLMGASNMVSLQKRPSGPDLCPAVF